MNPVLECRGIEKTFIDGARELRILRGVDLQVPEGQILAISGASGAGKSTLLHIMGTLDKPSKGDVFYSGQPLSRMSRAKINELRNGTIGFVFQFYHLLAEFNALENVMMPALCKGKPRKEAEARAEELLETVGLKDRMTHKPGYLSGGEQQRVAIARALFNKPTVVLSDEPTGNLDEGTGKGILDLLWRLNEEMKLTLVLVTHDLALAKSAHRWIHLHEGKAEERS